jgi:tetratricopeptide (TPR) repeat protein
MKKPIIAYFVIVLLLFPACTLSVLATRNQPETRSLPTVSEAPTATPTAEFSIEGMYAAAVDAANSGSWREALSLLDDLLAETPVYAQGYLLRGRAHAALGNSAKAEADFSTAIDQDGKLAAAYFERAQVYASGDNVEAALADLDRAIEIVPSYAAAYRARADLQVGLSNFTVARLDLEVYLTLIPNATDRNQIEDQIAQLLAAVEASAGEGELLYSDDFSNPASGWYSNGFEQAVMEYAQEGYRITLNSASSGAWAYSGQSFSNVRLEITATKLGGADDSNWYGLVCRLQVVEGDADFYAFIISSDGYYGIGKHVDGGPFGLISADKMQFSNAVIQGDDTNVIAAECVGNRLAIYVNGVLLAEVEDSDMSGGQAGLIVGTFTEPGAQILFDDFAAYAAVSQ